MSLVVVGFTGQTGAGKSIVRDALAGHGVAVVDADAVAHDITDSDLGCLVEVAQRFSCIILNDKGKLDRRRLGRIVFTDKKQLAALNKIMFPYITKAVSAKLAQAEKSGARFAVVDAAALFESGCDKLCDTVISVVAAPETRLERIMARDSLSRKDAADRVRAQHDDLYYVGRSNYVIENNSGQRELAAAAEGVFVRIAAGDMGASSRAAQNDSTAEDSAPDDGGEGT